MVDSTGRQVVNSRRQSNLYHPYQQQQQQQPQQRQNQNLNGSTQSSEEPFQCTFCQRVFTAQRYLTNHLKVHKNEEPKGDLFVDEQHHQGGGGVEEGVEAEDDMGLYTVEMVGVEMAMDDEEDEYDDHEGEEGEGDDDDDVVMMDIEGENQGGNQFPCHECGRVFSHFHILREHLLNHQSGDHRGSLDGNGFLGRLLH